MLGLFAATITPFMGHQSGVSAAKYQPAKGAAMEAVWETGKGQGFSIVQIPDVKMRRTLNSLRFQNSEASSIQTHLMAKLLV